MLQPERLSLLFGGGERVDLEEQPLGLNLPGKSRSWRKGAESVFCNMLNSGNEVHVTPKNVLETASLLKSSQENLSVILPVLSDTS